MKNTNVLDRKEQEILDGKYTSNAQVKRANKKLEEIRKQKKEILEPLDIKVVAAYNERLNQEISALCKSSEDYKKLEKDIEDKKRIINEDYNNHLKGEHTKIFQKIVDKKIQELQKGGVKISEKEFKQFDLVLDNLGYNQIILRVIYLKIEEILW